MAVKKKSTCSACYETVEAKVAAYRDLLPAVSKMQSGAAGVQDKCPDHWQTLSGRGRQGSDPADIVGIERTTLDNNKDPPAARRAHVINIAHENYCWLASN